MTIKYSNALPKKNIYIYSNGLRLRRHITARVVKHLLTTFSALNTRRTQGGGGGGDSHWPKKRRLQLGPLLSIFSII